MARGTALAAALLIALAAPACALADDGKGDDGHAKCPPAKQDKCKPAAQPKPAQQQSQPSPPPSPAGACYTDNASLTPPSVVAPVNTGILVQGVICASPAARAGMTSGAVITAVNGQRVGSPDDLSHAMARFRPGDTISVTWVTPAGKRTTGRIHLTTGPPL